MRTITEIRSQMVMRTTIERNTSGVDAYGGQGAPGWETLADQVACLAWETQSREVIGNQVAVVRTLSVIVPRSTDVTSADRLLDITDRQGNPRFPGPIDIKAVTWKPGFLELTGISTT